MKYKLKNKDSKEIHKVLVIKEGDCLGILFDEKNN